MAFYDHAAAQRERDAKEKFEELKKWIRSLDENSKINEWYLASEHINIMEFTIKEQEEKLKEYRSFFSTLSNLLPHKFSIHDRIG